MIKSKRRINKAMLVANVILIVLLAGLIGILQHHA